MTDINPQRPYTPSSLVEVPLRTGAHVELDLLPGPDGHVRYAYRLVPALEAWLADTVGPYEFVEQSFAQRFLRLSAADALVFMLRWL